MIFRKNQPRPIPSSEITSHQHFLSRRQFMQVSAAAAATALLAACAPEVMEATPGSGSTPSPYPTLETGEKVTDLNAILNYNNYYEFSTSKDGVAPQAKDFPTSPWQVEISGLVNKPQTLGMEELLSLFDQEERIYRLRCVEGWSMVIPWQGFPLRKLLERVEPQGSAQYVRFETITAPEEMPGQSNNLFPWPYVEGLRLDEAMHDLTLLATGLYGQTLAPQNGAPIRLVVPWKYGFKSGKSLVKITLQEKQPATFWQTIAPQEYGFYANVNPNVHHPRWTQNSERVIGEGGRRETQLFNGYANEVGQLYTNLDLKANY